VIPRAKKTGIDGLRAGAVLIRLAAAPVEGAANDALIALLATLLDVSRTQIHIVAGERSRQKRVRIEGVTADAIRRLLPP
jgi:uncharacterized protein